MALSLKAVPVERRLDLTLQRNRRQRREVLRQWAQGQVRLQRQAIEAREEVHLRFRKSRISNNVLERSHFEALSTIALGRYRFNMDL